MELGSNQWGTMKVLFLSTGEGFEEIYELQRSPLAKNPTFHPQFTPNMPQERTPQPYLPLTEELQQCFVVIGSLPPLAYCTILS